MHKAGIYRERLHELRIDDTYRLETNGPDLIFVLDKIFMSRKGFVVLYVGCSISTASALVRLRVALFQYQPFFIQSIRCHSQNSLLMCECFMVDEALKVSFFRVFPLHARCFIFSSSLSP